MLTSNQIPLHSEQEKERCQKMEGIANAINIIGICDLSYRRGEAEAASTLKNIAVDHLHDMINISSN